MSVTRVYAGDDEQYFPDFGRWIKPGDEVEFDSPPDDPRFITKKSKTVKPDSEEQ